MSWKTWLAALGIVAVTGAAIARIEHLERPRSVRYDLFYNDHSSGLRGERPAWVGQLQGWLRPDGSVTVGLEGERWYFVPCEKGSPNPCGPGGLRPDYRGRLGPAD